MLKKQAYSSDGNAAYFDEMLIPDGAARPAYRALMEWLERQTQGGIRTKQQEIGRA